MHIGIFSDQWFGGKDGVQGSTEEHYYEVTTSGLELSDLARHIRHYTTPDSTSNEALLRHPAYTRRLYNITERW